MINFNYETKEINIKLKEVKGYLDCENIIIENIKKHAANGVSVNDIENYLKELHNHLQNKMAINKNNINYINFMYAAGFLNTVINTPYWLGWLPTME